MNIGLTGGIATGKSTVSQMLVERGAILIDADVIAREVMEPGHPVLLEVRKRFGAGIIQEDGTLNRKKLGEIVFSNPKERKVLNEITHPAIRSEIKMRMANYEAAQPGCLIVVDIPLLYESGLESMFEQVMVVYVPREMQLKRLMQRDGLTLEQAEARVGAQLDIERKKERADILVDNSLGLDKTELQIEDFWRNKGL
ncbi:dephospho-CoA kinase [Paenibacillus lentus]|uniref:Dephospho-CoA kinase n=1 Tax=Paenibacillus lentus TaxID=1338368 RepID=A0A3S8RYT0_9BACL|nr:dephospho-CoA kinase [Paenibacillus lentus]AZK48081.1 dephospho-CoA kinase [Paenibacillus lentus]